MFESANTRSDFILHTAGMERFVGWEWFTIAFRHAYHSLNSSNFSFLTKEDRERCDMISGEELSPDETSKTNSSLKFSIPEIVPFNFKPLICKCKKDKRDMFTSQIIVVYKPFKITYLGWNKKGRFRTKRARKCRFSIGIYLLAASYVCCVRAKEPASIPTTLISKESSL